MSGRGPQARRTVVVFLVLAVALILGGYGLLRFFEPTPPPGEPAGVLQRTLVAEDQFKLPSLPAAAPAPAILQAPLFPVAIEVETPPTVLIRVVNERGVGVGSVQVEAYAEPDTGVWWQRFTDSSGYALLDCPEGTYYAQANPRGKITPYGKGYQPFEVIEGSSTTVELRLPDLTGQIDVLVHDDRGVPIEGVVVYADGPMGEIHEGERTTDEHGSASWTPIVEGAWTLRVRSADSAFDSSQEKRETVLIKPGQVRQVTFVLPRMGRVVVNRAQIPYIDDLIRLSVATESDQDTRDGPWDADRIVWQVPPGNALLSVEWAARVGVWSEPQFLSVLPGEETVAQVVAQPGASVLTGRVVDLVGTPVEGVKITANVYVDRLTAAQQFMGLRLLANKVVVSDASGDFAIKGLPYGELHARVNVRTAKGRHLAEYGSNTGQSSGFTVANAALPLELIVMPGVILQGDVSEPWATRWANDEVWLRIIQDQPSGSVRYRRHRPRLGDDGTFSIDHRGPAVYSAVMMDRSGVLTDPVLFVIREGLEEGATSTCHLIFTQ